MHELQKILLKRLLTDGKLRFAELTRGYDFEDNVVFHLKKLISDGFVQKTESEYAITPDGIKEITQFDLSDLSDKGFKTFFVGFRCMDPDGRLLLKSHPQGSNNFYNLPSGKPVFGESMELALTRTFQVITGLEIPSERFSFVSLHLKTIVTTSGEILFDDAFGIYDVVLSHTEQNDCKLAENIEWYTREEVLKLEDKWPEVDICLDKEKMQSYVAYTHTSNYVF